MKLSPNELILPHPRLQERTFFLNPLNDLQPDWTHPFLKMKAKEMLDSLPPNELQNIQELNSKKKIKEWLNGTSYSRRLYR